MSMNAIGLRYVLCPGSMPAPAFAEEYKKVYVCWRETWSRAFSELQVDKPFYSDSFTRQDYVGAIFHGSKCVALAFFRLMDATRDELAVDSYFSNWSDEHRRVLCSRGPRIIVCSNFTVHPDARGKQIGVHTKDLLMGMITETFLNSEADAMTGAVRVDRGVNGAGERWGAYVIDRKVPCDYGERNTDLIGFFKGHILAQPRHEMDALVKSLWAQRTVIPKMQIEKIYDSGASAPKKRVA